MGAALYDFNYSQKICIQFCNFFVAERKYFLEIRRGYFWKRKVNIFSSRKNSMENPCNLTFHVDMSMFLTFILKSHWIIYDFSIFGVTIWGRLSNIYFFLLIECFASKQHVLNKNVHRSLSHFQIFFLCDEFSCRVQNSFHFVLSLFSSIFNNNWQVHHGISFNLQIKKTPLNKKH